MLIQSAGPGAFQWGIPQVQKLALSEWGWGKQEHITGHIRGTNPTGCGLERTLEGKGPTWGIQLGRGPCCSLCWRAASLLRHAAPKPRQEAGSPAGSPKGSGAPACGRSQVGPPFADASSEGVWSIPEGCRSPQLSHWLSRRGFGWGWGTPCLGYPELAHEAAAAPLPLARSPNPRPARPKAPVWSAACFFRGSCLKVCICGFKAPPSLLPAP